VFEASSNSSTVSIAGWTVNYAYGIYSNSYRVGIIDPIAGDDTFKRESLVDPSTTSKLTFYAGTFDPGTSSAAE
jgi:hypothetical protein